MQTEITSYFHGYDVPQSELTDKIVRLGWNVEKINSSHEGFEVALKSSQGTPLTMQGQTVETALANALIYLTKQNQMARQGALQQTWQHKLPQIAQAYAAAPIFDIKAAPNWKHLSDDNEVRARVLQNVLEIQPSAEPVPYADGYDMAKDIQQGKIRVSTVDLKHPIWTPDQYYLYRLVHAVLGIAPSGGIPNWPGTNMAFAHHAHYLSDNAKQALFVETVGHKAYQIHYGAPGPKKICLLPGLLKKNTEDLSDGEPSESTNLPWLPKQSSLNSTWESGIDPPWPNAFIQDDPLNYFGLKEEARRLYRPWENYDRIVDDE